MAHQPHYMYPPTSPPPSSRLFIEESIYGTFWETNTNKRVVRVSYVEGNIPPPVKMLIYWSHLNEDKDGHPQTYAPPRSAADWRPLGALQPKDLIGNATSVKWVLSTTFHPLNAGDPIKRNPWYWAGVQHARTGSAGRRIDDRGTWLQDMNGDYPVFNPPGPHQDYYAPQTAINTRAGIPANPEEVPYAALATSLKYNIYAPVRLGDFGLAIRRGGASSPFVYADAGGETKTGDGSKSVGEVSTRLIRNLFGGPATDAVCFIVFPGSRRADGHVEPELMTSKVQERIRSLNAYDNVDDLDSYLRGLLPALSRWGYFRGMIPRNSIG